MTPGKVGRSQGHLLVYCIPQVSKAVLIFCSVSNRSKEIQYELLDSGRDQCHRCSLLAHIIQQGNMKDLHETLYITAWLGSLQRNPKPY